MQVGRERLRLLGELRDCGFCGERRSTQDYASALSALEVTDMTGWLPAQRYLGICVRLARDLAAGYG